MVGVKINIQGMNVSQFIVLTSEDNAYVLNALFCLQKGREKNQRGTEGESRRVAAVV